MCMGVCSVNRCVLECPALFSGCWSAVCFDFFNLDVTVTSHVVIQCLTDINKHIEHTHPMVLELL